MVPRVPHEVPALAWVKYDMFTVVPVALAAAGERTSSTSVMVDGPLAVHAAVIGVTNTGVPKLSADSTLSTEIIMALGTVVVTGLVWKIVVLEVDRREVGVPSIGLLAVSIPENTSMPATAVPPVLLGLAKVQV